MGADGRLRRLTDCLRRNGADLVIGRVPRGLTIAVALLVVVVVGALVGRAAAAAILPDLDDLSQIADRLVPASAADVQSEDVPSSGIGNLNIFVTPSPPSAFRAWTVDDQADAEVQRVVADLEERGWQVVDDERRSVRLLDGARTVDVHGDPPSAVRVSVSYRRGWLFFLPTLTAALGALGVLTVSGARRRTGHTARHRARRT